jgi:phage-related protein
MFGIDSGGARSGATEVNNAQKSVEDQSKSTGSTMGKSYDEAGNHVSKLGSLTSGIFMGMGMAVTNFAMEGPAKVVDVLKDAEKAYQDAAVSTAKLDTAMKNNVPGLSNNAAKLAGVASAADKAMESNLNLGFSMDDQRNSMALLVGVTKSTGQAQDDMSKAMDLARLRGIDLASATNIVIKAQEGNTGALKKLGIVVAPVTTAMDKLTASHKNATAAQIAAAKAADLQATETAALTDITKLAGGQAEAYANTSAGKLAAAHAKVTEAMVKLGSITDQIVQAVLPGLADAFENIMDAVGPVLQQLGQDMPGIIATVKGAIKDLADTFGPLIGDIKDALPGAISILETVFDGLSGFLGPIIKAIGKDLPGAFKAVSDEITAVEGFISGLIPHFGSGGAGGAATGLGKDIDHLRTMFSTAFADIQVIVKIALGMIENFWKTFGGDIMGAIKVYMQYIQDTINNVLDIIQGVFDIFAGLFSGDWSKVWKGVQEVFGGIWNQIGSMLKAALDLIPIMLDAAGKVIGGIWGNIWHGLETAAQGIWSGITGGINSYLVLPVKGALSGLVGFVTGLPGAIGKAAAGMFDGIWNAFKGAINMIIKGWNSLEFKFGGFDLGPLGKVASFDMKVPKIPTLAAGTPNWPGGPAIVGEKGPELVNLPTGSSVIPHDQTAAMLSGGGKPVEVNIYNPVPEPASVSVAHANLMLAYSGRSGN